MQQPPFEMMVLPNKDSYVYARQIMQQMSDTQSITDDKEKESSYSMIPLYNSTVHYSSLEDCGWFYPSMSKEQARSFLDRLPYGCFLLRTSSLAVHKYTLSVKSSHGVVNIRIGISQASGITLYHLDSSRKITEKALETRCIVDLIQQLVCTQALDSYQFTDNRGQNILLELHKPAIKEPHSLKHLCRLALNRSMQHQQSSASVLHSLPIPTSLRNYLSRYSSHL